DDYITALATTPDGSLWIGTWSGGLTRYHGGRFETLTTADGLPHDNVLVIHADPDGTLWVGTVEGVARYRDGRIEAFSTAHGLHNEVIWTLLRDADGVLWAGTQEGLHRYEDGRFTALTQADGLPSDYILSMHSDAEGALWLATWGGGLIRYHHGRFDALTAEHGLPSDNIFAILEDDAGSLWLTGNLGITRVSKAAVQAFFEGGTPPAITVYDRKDGLRSKECSGGSQPAAWKARDGMLWFPTVKGVAGIHPEHMRLNGVPPLVHIEQVIDGDSLLAPAGSVTLPAGHTNIALRYAGLSLLQPDQNRFRYKLEGADDAWVEAGTRQTAYYTNLPPGAYQFRVQASNNDGVWSDVEARLHIQIEPFFYQRLYFIVLVALGLLLLGYLAYRLRVRQLQSRAEELTRLVEERTRDIRIAKEKTEQAKAIIESQALELKTLNQGLEEDVEREVALRLAEREKYEASLLIAKERAEASARFKSAILDNMNHEFRTPLTAITSAVQILESEIPKPLAEFVEIIEHSSSRLLRTLKGLLQLSTVDAQHYHTKTERIDVRRPIRDVVEEVASTAEAKALRLEVSLPEGPVPAAVNRDAFEHILRHLLDNAIKFTDEGGVAVTLQCDAEERAVVIVQDTGVGMSSSFLPYAFEAFRQESEGLNRDYEGCGLGLTVAQRLAHMMRMHLEIESEEGQGTTVRIHLSMAAPAPGGPRSPEDRRSNPGRGEKTPGGPLHPRAARRD
ncbi:MAG: two-component regulator propeller domain-containing protein, partial [Rhodothermales bacterium]|nr:two-component regulator propeller domain-containing protein [Rhodothermales bacterium]